MGIKLFSSSSSESPNWKPPNPPDPNPRVFRIHKTVQHGDYTIVWINYPQATSFEGNKILVLEGMTTEDVHKQTEIDPHFSKDGNVVARFRPDPEGWGDALSYVSEKNFYRFNKVVEQTRRS